MVVPAALRQWPYVDICRPSTMKATSRTMLTRIPTPAIAVAAADPCGRAVRPRLARASEVTASHIATTPASSA